MTIARRPEPSRTGGVPRVIDDTGHAGMTERGEQGMDTKIRIHRQPKTLITGNGSVSRIGDEARKLGATRVCIITDPGVACAGNVDDVERPLRNAGLEVGVYDKAVPEPPMSSIHEGVEFAEKGGYDLIVGFGGGSAIDVAKITSVLPHSGKTVEDLVGIDKVPRKGLPLIAVPTTAGTGSEATAVAIFSNEKLNVKQGVVSPHLIPNIGLIDPVLTYSCPAGVTAAAGMDALIHNIEAYISVNATMHTDPLAYEGIKLISKSIRTAVYDGQNAWARHNMAIGSLLGGIAFGNAGVGAVHALSYPIGGTFHVPHGVANTLMLPWVMEYNMLACLQWFNEIGEAMGERLEGLSLREGAEKTLAALRQLAVDLEVPLYLSDVGIPASAVEDLADGAMTQTRLLGNNPRRLTREDVVRIYTNAAVRPGSTPVEKKAAAAIAG
jgi:alcohol dehydrogenase class IV